MNGVLERSHRGRGVLVVSLIVAIAALFLFFSTRYQRSIKEAAQTAQEAQTAGVDIEASMKEGLASLYEKNDAVSAAAAFRKVLAAKADHYGANYQLAEAVYRSEGPAAAAPLWERVLELANGYHDATTAAKAQQRLSGQEESEEVLMQRGVDALYTRAKPNEAIPLFRRVLAKNPSHYGATYQLAAALTRAGDSSEARELWSRVLQMAESYRDEETASRASRELGSSVPVAP